MHLPPMGTNFCHRKYLKHKTINMDQNETFPFTILTNGTYGGIGGGDCFKK